ncbi:hypothetical protein AZE42_10638 [Rhizopogon vesiculosus]|uniref:DUF6533 domain-containing protein n=1 Tax=Rhizopogon vesiculosus TaxID=180088 RepID=A0A1J8PTR8_9AGAM|nr:hypothetical protein AZE42_10638 [Rhizopogon vesiculosus]
MIPVGDRQSIRKFSIVACSSMVVYDWALTFGQECKEWNSPDDGIPLYRFDVPLPFFA